MVKHLIYTHSDYSDAWKPLFRSLEEHMPEAQGYVCTDRPHNFGSRWTNITYDSRRAYRERLLGCLRQITDKTILFQHEDMFLYDRPDLDRINIYDEMIRSDKIDFVKLIRAGRIRGNPYSKERPELKRLDNRFSYVFAIQPSLWSKATLQSVLGNCQVRDIWSLEVEGTRVCKEQGVRGFYVDDGGQRRGRWHYDTKVYPYIATAIVKGKWNMREYRRELGPLLAECGINPESRGIST